MPFKSFTGGMQREVRGRLKRKKKKRFPLDFHSKQPKFLSMTCKTPSQSDSPSPKEFLIISATQTIFHLQTLVYISTFSRRDHPSRAVEQVLNIVK